MGFRYLRVKSFPIEVCGTVALGTSLQTIAGKPTTACQHLVSGRCRSVCVGGEPAMNG